MIAADSSESTHLHWKLPSGFCVSNWRKTVTSLVVPGTAAATAAAITAANTMMNFILNLCFVTLVSGSRNVNNIHLITPILFILEELEEFTKPQRMAHGVITMRVLRARKICIKINQEKKTISPRECVCLQASDNRKEVEGSPTFDKFM